MFIDSHAHLTNDAFAEDIEAVLSRAFEAGVEQIINICTHPQQVEKGLLLSAIKAPRRPQLYLAAATPPHDIEKEGETCFAQMEQYAKEGHLVAIGETGLDYHYYQESKEIQKHFLRRYMQLARLYSLPLVIHCRDAFSDFFEILDAEAAGHPGALHCFTGNKEEAEQLVARGWYLSFSGIVTFKKSLELQQIAKELPIEHLLIETDAPYLAPTPHRSQRNEPSFLPHTARSIAQLRGISLEALREATAQNTSTLFQLKDSRSCFSK